MTKTPLLVPPSSRTPRIAMAVKTLEAMKAMTATKGQKKAQAKQAADQKKGSQKGEGATKMKGSCICPICKATLPSYKLMAEHYGSKHPKETVPAEGSF